MAKTDYYIPHYFDDGTYDFTVRLRGSENKDEIIKALKAIHDSYEKLTFNGKKYFSGSEEFGLLPQYFTRTDPEGRIQGTGPGGKTGEELQVQILDAQEQIKEQVPALKELLSEEEYNKLYPALKNGRTSVDNVVNRILGYDELIDDYLENAKYGFAEEFENSPEVVKEKIAQLREAVQNGSTAKIDDGSAPRLSLASEYEAHAVTGVARVISEAKDIEKAKEDWLKITEDVQSGKLQTTAQISGEFAKFAHKHEIPTEQLGLLNAVFADFDAKAAAKDVGDRLTFLADHKDQIEGKSSAVAKGDDKSEEKDREAEPDGKGKGDGKVAEGKVDKGKADDADKKVADKVPAAPDGLTPEQQAFFTKAHQIPYETYAEFFKKIEGAGNEILISDKDSAKFSQEDAITFNAYLVKTGRDVKTLADPTKIDSVAAEAILAKQREGKINDDGVLGQNTAGIFAGESVLLAKGAEIDDASKRGLAAYAQAKEAQFYPELHAQRKANGQVDFDMKAASDAAEHFFGMPEGAHYGNFSAANPNLELKDYERLAETIASAVGVKGYDLPDSKDGMIISKIKPEVLEKLRDPIVPLNEVPTDVRSMTIALKNNDVEDFVNEHKEALAKLDQSKKGYEGVPAGMVADAETMQEKVKASQTVAKD